MNAALNLVHQLLLEKGIAFVRYSLPESKISETLICYHPASFQNLNELAEKEAEGFVFAPFAPDEKSPLWFYHADITLDEYAANQNVIDYLSGLPDSKIRSPFNPKSTTKSEYRTAFSTYLNALKSRKLDKAILSKIRVKQKTIESPLAIYTKLVEAYPTAFVYMINLPSGDLWMGATPERLIQQEKDGIQTMALAGTQQLNQRKVNDIVWEKKEIEEQAYVKNYVLNQLNSVSDAVQVSANYTVAAGNLVHLRTDFVVNQYFNRAEIYNLVNLLHPTPAVCGIPLEEAKALILQTEKHDREYYTGYLGPINKNSLALFVNLRCMKMEQENFALYVGGGITRDSELDKEWDETEAKAQTLLSVLAF